MSEPELRQTLLGCGTTKTRKREGEDEWVTPRAFIEALGPFDLDPCSPIPSRRPWPTAALHYTIEDDGLLQNWRGLVWLNPPFSAVAAWVQRLADHGSGIALTAARTDALWFHRQVFARAKTILFYRHRIRFCHTNGEESSMTLPAPVCLFAYGDLAAQRLRDANLCGYLIELR